MPFAPETVERMYLCFSVDKTNLSTTVPPISDNISARIHYIMFFPICQHIKYKSN